MFIYFDYYSLLSLFNIPTQVKFHSSPQEENALT